MGQRADHIRVVCAATYQPKKHCNIYTKEVAQKLGVYLPLGAGADADSLLRSLDGQWRHITAAEAAKLSGEGEFILAGLKSYEFVPRKDGRKTTHGHLCVVVAGEVAGLPAVYSANNEEEGKYDGKSKGDKPLSGWVFSHADARNVHFYAPPLVLKDSI